MQTQSAASLYAMPWLTDGAIRELTQFIEARRATEDRVSVLEFGSGGSTIWFAERTHRVVSFEDNKQWFREVRSRLRKKNISHVDLRLAPLPYFSGIGALDDGSFDIVLVDGRDRVECVRQSRSKLAPGGLFVVDNMERAGPLLEPGRYFEINALLAAWPRKDHPQRDGKDYHNGAGWITTTWRRPA
jgi:predicted O-methyltransferase YrrM